jgi:hypothetical protein
MEIAAILAIIFIVHRYFPLRKPMPFPTPKGRSIDPLPNQKKGREMSGRRCSPLKSKHQIKVKIIAVKLLNPMHIQIVNCKVLPDLRQLLARSPKLCD